MRSRRREGGIGLSAAVSFLGIAAAVAVLVAVMGVMNGFRSDLVQRMLGFDGHAQAVEARGDEASAAAIVEKLLGQPDVVAAYPLLEGQALAVGGQAAGVVVRAVRGHDVAAMRVLEDGVVSGELSAFRSGDAPPTIALGQGLARRAGVQVGQEISLLAPSASSTPFGAGPRELSYRVGAIFTTGISLYDDAYAFLPLAEGQRLFGRPDEVDAVEIILRDAQSAERLRPLLTRLAQSVEPASQVITWQDRNSAYFATLQIERTVMRLILMLVVAIAAMNIISGLIMLVKNKGRDIAVLRTMGADRRDVLAVFVAAGAMIGVSGALFGAALGTLFCLNIGSVQTALELIFGVSLFSPDIYLLPKIPARIDPLEMGLVLVWSIVMALWATLPPALRASRLEPVEALRYE